MIAYKLTFTTTTGRSVSALYETAEQAEQAINMFLLADEMVETYSIERVEYQPVEVPPSS